MSIHIAVGLIPVKCFDHEGFFSYKMGGVSGHSTCVSSHIRPSDTGNWNTRCTILCLIVICDVFMSQMPTSKCVCVRDTCGNCTLIHNFIMDAETSVKNL